MKATGLELGRWLTTCGKIVDKTIMEADTDRDGKISFEEFTKMVENTDISMSMTLGTRIALFSQATMVLQPQP